MPWHNQYNLRRKHDNSIGNDSIIQKHVLAVKMAPVADTALNHRSVVSPYTSNQTKWCAPLLGNNAVTPRIMVEIVPNLGHNGTLRLPSIFHTFTLV